MAALKRAVEMKPDFWLGYRSLSAIYELLGDYENQKSALEKAIALKPDDYSNRFNYAVFLATYGQASEAIAEVSESIRNDHSECRSPDAMNVNRDTRASWPPKPTSTKANQDSTHEITSSVVVISSAACEPAADGSIVSASWA